MHLKKSIATFLAISLIVTFSTFVRIFHEISPRQKLEQFEKIEFLTLPRSCNIQIPVSLLILVVSRPENFKKRELARYIWGKKRLETILLFIFGTTDDEITQRNVNLENELYQDIVQGNTTEANLEQVSYLNYAVNYCDNFDYVLKISDLVYPNLEAVLRLVRELKMFGGRRERILCSGVASREIFHKEEVRHCSNAAVLYSYEAVHRLSKQARRLKVKQASEAYITGKLRSMAKINMTDMKNFYVPKENYENAFRDILLNDPGTDLPEPILFMTVPEANLQKMFAIRNYLQQRNSEKSIVKQLKLK